jgi:hypothetical protein
MVMGIAFRNEEILSSIKWYFEAKNLSLKNAISIQLPLSVEAQKDIRLYYSQYFVYLLSAMELLLEKEYPHKADFEKILIASFTFPGFPNAMENYYFLRELRNSIIHRGYDITTSAHTKDNKILFIAPDKVKSRNEKVEYQAYGFYILEIIEKTEKVVGKMFCTYIDNVGLLQPSIHHGEILKHAISFVANTNLKIMPQWAKEMALEALPTIDFEAIQKSQFSELKEILMTNVIAQTAG